MEEGALPARSWTWLAQSSSHGRRCAAFLQLDMACTVSSSHGWRCAVFVQLDMVCTVSSSHGGRCAVFVQLTWLAQSFSHGRRCAVFVQLDMTLSAFVQLMIVNTVFFSWEKERFVFVLLDM
eukprot:scaffold103352_cov21-Tisochrysis_lutea.AAC.1